MKQKRRNHCSEFKARIALEALKGIRTAQQIAAEHKVGLVVPEVLWLTSSERRPV